MRAPLAADGSLVSYARYEQTLTEVAPFAATLTIQSIVRGRSAAHFIWTDEQGRTWPMFMTDMVALLEHGVEEGGSVTSTWAVQKRGANYGIRLAKKDERA